MKFTDEVIRIVQADAVVLRRDQPELAGGIDHLVRAGHLRAVLAGVYAPASQVTDPRIRAIAISRADPGAVITHRAAAWLSYWPELTPPRSVSVAATTRRPREGFTFSRRTVPAELVQVRRGMRLSAPALTALDLSTLEQSEPLDVALRRRVVTTHELEEALHLTRGRRGNIERWKLVVESHINPWSYAERIACRVLRRFGVTGWVVNHRICVESGSIYYLDIAFLDVLLAVEIDGRTHREPAAFDADLRRQNEVHQEGWVVLRFSTGQLDADPAGFIRAITQMIVLRRSRADDDQVENASLDARITGCKRLVRRRTLHSRPRRSSTTLDAPEEDVTGVPDETAGSPTPRTPPAGRCRG